MAFTFEAELGTGSATATSYVSVEDADDLIYLNIHANTKWDVLSLDEKQRLLSYASSNLDTLVSWVGNKTIATSNLRWPRTGVCDQENTLIPADSIPSQVKQATAEYARYIIDEDRTLERDQEGLDSIKVDVIEIDFWDGHTVGVFPPYVSHILRGLGDVHGTSGMSFIKLKR